MERNSTGAIISGPKAGIITNGLGKKVSWIHSDGYKQISNDEDIMGLSFYLLKVQQDIKGGSFDQKNHDKFTLAVAHQNSIGESSPRKKSCCSCVGGRCSARCGCKGAKRRCSSTCYCSGSCDNPLNTH